VESALREGGGEPGLRLIETVLWDGTRAPRWPLHDQRLRRSAALLGWSCPEVAPAGPSHPARLRLTLDRDGSAEWTVAALPAVKAEWRVGLAAERLRSDDPWLRVKSDETRGLRPRPRRTARGAGRGDLPERSAALPQDARLSQPYLRLRKGT
jgi:hypothetical protein